VLLNYMQKFAHKMGKDKRYFQFIWTNGLTHDYLNTGILGDDHLKSTLEWFHEGGYLNQTILILMSDHGARYGGIMEYQQGQIENRMPFLFFVIPSWFKQKYARAFQNLKDNHDRLTTPFDVYETLTDLITLKHITGNEIEKREMAVVEIINLSVPCGISLFLPIPLERTCEMARIPHSYCPCRNLTSISTNNPEVKQAANYAVCYINSLVEKYPQCAVLSLSDVKSAQVAKDHVGNEDYQIIFETRPGDALFEGSVVRDQRGVWNVSGKFDRTNSHGNQSYCVESKLAKLSCYCTDLNEEFKLQSES